MEAPNRPLSLLSSLARFVAALALAVAAEPAEAQPDASWTESGDVTIYYRLVEGGTRYGKEAADIIETDIIDEITVGDSGLIGNQQTGTLTIEGVGDEVTPRYLADVFVLVGLLELNDAFVDSNFIRVGVNVQSQFTDLSEGTLSVMLSDVGGAVTIRNGYLTCQLSRMANITISELGHAQIAGCTIDAISMSGLAQVSIGGSTIDASNPGFRGNTVIANSTITSTNGTVVEGAIQIGQSGEPTIWDASGTITVGQNTVATDLTVTDSTIESGVATVHGGGNTNLVMQGASLWRSIGVFQFQGSTVTADLNSASRIEAGTHLWIGGAQVTVRSGVGTDSRIDVAGDLGLGNFDEDTFLDGTLTIEDGGYVDVDGTFTIRPLATLNLNGGTLRVGAFDNQGTFNENGGTLIVPEPAATGVAALLALALVARRRRAQRTGAG